MKKCRECGQSTLAVTNSEIDSAVLNSGVRSIWHVPDAGEATLIRGRAYYSARIHGVRIRTGYSDTRLWLEQVDEAD